MDGSLILWLLVLFLIGLLVGRLLPGFGAVLGWLVVGITVVGAIMVYVTATSHWHGLGGLDVVFGVVGAAIVLAVGLPVGAGILFATGLVRAVAKDRDSRLLAGEVACPSCGGVNVAHDELCRSCGSRLQRPA